MKIVKKHNKYRLFLNEKTGIDIEINSALHLRDILKYGTRFYQVVNILDNSNSTLRVGEAKFVLQLVSTDELIETAYNVKKI